MKTADEIIEKIARARLTEYMGERFNETAAAYIARIERREIRELREAEGFFRDESGLPFFVPEADFKLRANGTFHTGRFMQSNFRRADSIGDDRYVIFGLAEDNMKVLWCAWYSDFGIAQVWADLRAMGLDEFEALPHRELNILAGQIHKARKLIENAGDDKTAFTTGWKLSALARAAEGIKGGEIQF